MDAVIRSEVDMYPQLAKIHITKSPRKAKPKPGTTSPTATRSSPTPVKVTNASPTYVSQFWKTLLFHIDPLKSPIASGAPTYTAKIASSSASNTCSETRAAALSTPVTVELL